MKPVDQNQLKPPVYRCLKDLREREREAKNVGIENILSLTNPADSCLALAWFLDHVESKVWSGTLCKSMCCFWWGSPSRSAKTSEKQLFQSTACLLQTYPTSNSLSSLQRPRRAKSHHLNMLSLFGPGMAIYPFASWNGSSWISLLPYHVQHGVIFFLQGANWVQKKILSWHVLTHLDVSDVQALPSEATPTSPTARRTSPVSFFRRHLSPWPTATITESTLVANMPQKRIKTWLKTILDITYIYIYTSNYRWFRHKNIKKDIKHIKKYHNCCSSGTQFLRCVVKEASISLAFSSALRFKFSKLKQPGCSPRS